MLMKIYKNGAFEKLISRISHIIKLYLLSHFSGTKFGGWSERQGKCCVPKQPSLIIQSPHEVSPKRLDHHSTAQEKRNRHKFQLFISLKINFYNENVFAENQKSDEQVDDSTMIIKLAANRNE